MKCNRLSLWFLLGMLVFGSDIRRAHADDCDVIWKKCWAFCQMDEDPTTCYDRCMEFYGCKKGDPGIELWDQVTDEAT